LPLSPCPSPAASRVQGYASFFIHLIGILSYYGSMRSFSPFLLLPLFCDEQLFVPFLHKLSEPFSCSPESWSCHFEAALTRTAPTPSSFPYSSMLPGPSPLKGFIFFLSRRLTSRFYRRTPVDVTIPTITISLPRPFFST